ncbi:MAG: serine/threonine-protein kinase [Planctomycetota bacterium]
MRSPPSTPSDAAREAFFAALEDRPDDPRRAMAAMALPESVKTEVLSLVEAFERGGALAEAACGAGGAIERGIEELGEAATRTVDRAIPERIGAYRVLRKIGESARAVVLLAMQERPIQREVALKLFYEDSEDDSIRARIELERQILAALEHPGIARVYDFGIDGSGRPFLVMEHVRDGTVTDWCRRRGTPTRDRVRLFLQVADAVRHAHARGVLHCDLKPANILVQELEGAPHAKVIDFGIARAFGGALAARTALIDVPASLGTLLAMSPEALEPGGGRLDVRSDVFGLGLVLWEMLADRPPRPLPSGGVDEALQVAIDGWVPSLPAALPDVSPDLAAIVGRACAPDPQTRFQSVAELTSDLESWLAGREVASRPRSLGERVRLALRPRWKTAVLLAASVVAAVTWVRMETAAVRGRLADLRARAELAVAAASALRNVAGRAAEQEALVLEALSATRAALEVAEPNREVLELRAAALEEAILPRLVVGDHTSPETVRLVNELVSIREDLFAADGDAPALERLSVALAYQLDTVRGSPAYEPLEARQLAIDEELHARHPEVRVYADNLCWSCQRVLDPMWKRGQRAKALELLRRSAEIAEESLARHGPSALTLHTAAASALYEACAAEGDGSPIEKIISATKRGRDRGQALLELSPHHARGATFFLHCGLVECGALIEQGAPERAAEVVAEARGLAAEAAALTTDSGYHGFPIADSFAWEAQAWLAAGDARRAEIAIEGLVREIDRDRAPMRRHNVLAEMLAKRDVLRIRAELQRGEVDGARERIGELVTAWRRDPQGDASLALDELAMQLHAHVREGQSSDSVRAMIREVAAALDSEFEASDRAQPSGLEPRLSRIALALLLDRPDRVGPIATAIRALPNHNLATEAALLRLERAARSVAEAMEVGDFGSP